MDTRTQPAQTVMGIRFCVVQASLVHVAYFFQPCDLNIFLVDDVFGLELTSCPTLVVLTNPFEPVQFARHPSLQAVAQSRVCNSFDFQI